MATSNGSKKSVIELNGNQATTLIRAVDVVIAQVKRSMAKETDARIIELRNQNIVELQALQNQIAYGGKELV